MKILLRVFTVVILTIVGVTSCIGGLSLIMDPTGVSLGLSLRILENSPFTNFMIPGMILFSFNGILSLLTSLFVLLKSEHHPRFVVLQGCILTIWILAQMILTTSTIYLLLFLGMTGILLIVLGVLMERENRKPNVATPYKV